METYEGGWLVFGEILLRRAHFFKGFDYWQKLAQAPKGLVFCGGGEPQGRSSGCSVLPWRSLAEW